MKHQITWPGWTPTKLDTWIQTALEEDLEGADVTSWSTIPQPQAGTAQGVAKQDLVVCGLPIAQRIFELLDPQIVWEPLVEEGQSIQKGDVLFRISGEIHAILAGERLMLNVMQHLSGIATVAQAFSQEVAGTQARVVDTRKTLPGLRFLQRYAVRVGGCHNHRYHLGSGVLIKENHIRSAGSITKAVQAAKQRAPHTLRIEIEVTSLDEMNEAIQAGADVVMLDNMTPEQVRKAVECASGSVLLEASGNIRLHNARAYAEAGVDIISVGALTHSIQAADISLLVEA